MPSDRIEEGIHMYLIQTSRRTVTSMKSENNVFRARLAIYESTSSRGPKSNGFRGNSRPSPLLSHRPAVALDNEGRDEEQNATSPWTFHEPRHPPKGSPLNLMCVGGSILRSSIDLQKCSPNGQSCGLASTRHSQFLVQLIPFDPAFTAPPNRTEIARPSIRQLGLTPKSSSAFGDSAGSRTEQLLFSRRTPGLTGASGLPWK